MKLLNNYFLNNINKFPNKNYVVTDENEYSYKTTATYVNKLITKLKKINMKNGDILSLILPNCYEYILFFHACSKLGIVFNPYPDNLISIDLLKYISFVKPKKIVCDEKRYNSLKKITKKKIIKVGKNFLRDLFLEKETNINLKFDKKKIACLYYSSGSTSNPKSILYSHANITNLCNSINKDFKFNSNDNHLVVLPLGHTAAINYSFLPCTIAGGTIILMKDLLGEKRKLFWKKLKYYKITFVELVPSLVIAILNTKYKSEEYKNINILKFIGSGSSILPKELQSKFIKKFKVKLVNLYGLSETGPTHYDNPNIKNWKIGSIGKPLNVNKVIILDSNFRECKPLEKGEIAIKGKNVFPGYFQNSLLTKKSFYKDWFLSGDIGFKDKKGFFYYVGRKKEIIIKGGINISPDEIDEILYKHKYVEKVLTIGMHDKILGETINSFIVTKKRKKLNPNKIIDFCKKYLSPIKVPDKIHIIKTIPKTNSGKFSRKKLLEKISN